MTCCLRRAKARFERTFQKTSQMRSRQQQQSHELAAVTNEATFMPRPELGDDLDTNMTDIGTRTAEIAANAPRYRRRSSTFIDAIHDVPEDKSLAPAQLYSTMSGRLFHSGRIAIVMVGLPARGKT